MSKSLGNSPDPLDVIAEYGADALTVYCYLSCTTWTGCSCSVPINVRLEETLQIRFGMPEDFFL